MAEPLHVGGVNIEPVDYRALSDDQIRLLNVFENVIREDAAPEDPERPIDLTEAEVRTLPEHFVVHEFWGLDGDGGLAAQAFASWMNTEDNRHAAHVGLEVRPDLRRRGIGKALLGLLVDVIAADGRSLIIGTSTTRAPAGGAFAERVGAELG
ncbi:MAG: GNAT family N-acetyltransferase, partial [Actinomycetota bacterium]